MEEGKVTKFHTLSSLTKLNYAPHLPPSPPPAPLTPYNYIMGPVMTNWAVEILIAVD